MSRLVELKNYKEAVQMDFSITEHLNITDQEILELAAKENIKIQNSETKLEKLKNISKISNK